jgi:putative hydrolase of the HAD superfamily
VGWRKPAKQIFEFALRKFNANPQDCVFVGDNPQWDLMGPEAVGIAAILIDRQGAAKDPEARPIRNLHELPGRIQFYV